ncbi:MAG: hypothetical protein HUU12_03515 [Anaerolineales bacterium]|nr:hypothetical protein [Anaerolineales bacterium]
MESERPEDFSEPSKGKIETFGTFFLIIAEVWTRAKQPLPYLPIASMTATAAT